MSSKQGQDTFFTELYEHFNARNIDWVIDHMIAEVMWANGMEGGHVYGHDGVREYWTRQFTQVNAKVEPTRIIMENGRAVIEVHQLVYDLEGKLLADQWVEHIFELEGDKIKRFDIGSDKPLVPDVQLAHSN